MPEFDSPRPNFESPPVVEVALSVQFEPLHALGTPQLGLLWEQYKRELPRTEDKPGLASVIENFEEPKPTPAPVQVREPLPPRCWFTSDDGIELVQIQRDRFVFNWRELATGQPYPRYEKVKRKFLKHFATFQKCLRDQEIGKVLSNQCEVTYVNHLLVGEGFEKWGRLHDIFSVWSKRYSDDFLPAPEDARFYVRYRIGEDDGNPIGRLYISAEPRLRQEDNSPLIYLVLNARGAPLGKNLKGITDFFDVGREYIVRGFASCTTRRMHKLWERTDV